MQMLFGVLNGRIGTIDPPYGRLVVLFYQQCRKFCMSAKEGAENFAELKTAILGRDIIHAQDSGIWTD
ncbi:MAG: hypothetical protein ACI3XZ_04040 [Butyricicoccus sp.]